MRKYESFSCTCMWVALHYITSYDFITFGYFVDFNLINGFLRVKMVLVISIIVLDIHCLHDSFVTENEGKIYKIV